MTEIDLFKTKLLNGLPNSLTRQIEPHIGEALAWHGKPSQMKRQQQLDILGWACCKRFDEIRAQFREQSDSSCFPCFARERWPRIDEWFDLEADIDDPDFYRDDYAELSRDVYECSITTALH